jgi:hypothetical protein
VQGILEILDLGRIDDDSTDNKGIVFLEREVAVHKICVDKRLCSLAERGSSGTRYLHPGIEFRV